MLTTIDPVRVLILIIVSACAGSARPAVINRLDALPGDPEKRNAILDSAHAEAGPEHRKPLPPKQRKIETTAATAAAVLGILFSKSENVTLGVGQVIDENLLVQEPQQPKPKAKTNAKTNASDNDEKKADEPAVEPPDGEVLVPWVRLK